MLKKLFKKRETRTQKSETQILSDTAKLEPDVESFDVRGFVDQCYKPDFQQHVKSFFQETKPDQFNGNTFDNSLHTIQELALLKVTAESEERKQAWRKIGMLQFREHQQLTMQIEMLQTHQQFLEEEVLYEK